MAGQQIKQPSIFGRLGTGIGKGLAEQVPKEIERGRLASGLQELGQQKNLTPFQQFAQLSAIPGITPQMIESGSNLLRQQAQRQGYANRGKEGTQGIPESQGPSLNSVDFANLNQGKPSSKATSSNQIPQGNYPAGQPQIVEKNPLSKELQPAIPWTPEQRDSEISRVWDQNPQLTFPEVSQIVADNERRYLAAPEAYKKQQEDLEGIQNKVNAEVEKQLRKKLHIPKDKEIYEGNKITGESLNRVERGVSRDLRMNPNANVNDLVNKWTDLALRNDVDKNNLSTLAGRGLDEKLFKKGETLEKLKSISKSFKEFGNSEEFYNTLKTDFGLSPEGAASIAYPLSKSADNYVGKIKESNAANYNQNAIKYANELSNYLTREDSILSIAKQIKEHDPFFDIKTFLSEVRDIQDELGLTAQQKTEINTRGIADLFPNWGDIFLFPKGGKGL